MSDADVKLAGCPFCGAAMVERHALWPSEGDTDAIIHAAPTDCPLTDFSMDTADQGASVRAAWNRRSGTEALVRALREAEAALRCAVFESDTPTYRDALKIVAAALKEQEAQP